MQWNVYRYNVNKKEIEVFNIFKHSAFVEECLELYKKYRKDKSKFSAELKRTLMYYYWSKYEWEICVSELYGNSYGERTETKVDVFQQVMLNWDAFIDYTWTIFENGDC